MSGTQAPTSKRVVARAAAIVGGQAKLAELLGAANEEVAAWLAGRLEPSWPHYDRMLTLMLDHLDKTAPPLVVLKASANPLNPKQPDPASPDAG